MMQQKQKKQQVLYAQQINVQNNNASYQFDDINGMNYFDQAVSNANMPSAQYYR